MVGPVVGKPASFVTINQTTQLLELKKKKKENKIVNVESCKKVNIRSPKGTVRLNITHVIE